MTPGARLQALIELLDNVTGGGAADAAASAYFRGRRYIGSKDRSWIAEHLYMLLRRLARLDWWLNRVLDRPAGAPPPPARHRVFADFLLAGEYPARLADQCDGGAYRPGPLSRAERTLFEVLPGQALNHPEQPDWVRAECPEWLLAAMGGEMTALDRAAPLDLRVNPLKGTRDQALAALTAEGMTVTPCRLSPLGIRVKGRPPLGQSPSFKDGLVEIQDEGSQIAAALVAAMPGMAVLDFCAGAGGKTLALAGQMQNKGRLVACDISGPRLERAVTRLRRAGVHNVERRALDAEGRKWTKRQAGRFDRVLIDAPCSGTGTWRRNPDMRWKLTQADLDNLQATQTGLIAETAPMVKPGGRLVYVTCSLLDSENGAIVERFLENHSDFKTIDIASLWPMAVGGAAPVAGPYLRLNPAAHDTDGFFCAVLERAA